MSPAARSRRLALLVAALVLVGALAAVSVGAWLERAGPDPEPTPTALATPTPAPPTPTATPTPAADQAERFSAVARAVERIRGHDFPDEPRPVVLTQAEIAERVEEMLAEYTPEEADADRRVLALLGAVPGDVDLRSLLRDALGEQVAGFYDPETGELVVASDDAEIGAFAEVALAHELAHALVDAVVGLPVRDDPDDGEEDAARAAQAVVEGDATLVMLRYVQGVMSPDARAELLREQLTAGAGDALQRLPHYLRRSLLFPYEDGLAFVARVHASGGWGLVDEAMRRPPTSTLEILRPELWLDGGHDVTPVSTPSDAGDGWELESRRALGAADLLFLFEAPGGAPDRRLDDARDRALLWRGGALVHWTRGEESALAVALDGQAGLCSAITGWYRRAFPDASERSAGGATEFSRAGQEAVVRCDGREVRVGIAPERGLARRLAATS